MRVSAHAQRGQALPITAIGIVALIAVSLFSVDYANTIRWQIRAQNAADAAAQAVIAIQTQEFNEMTATLYAAAVEEYRIRRNLNAMSMAVYDQGGCAQQAGGMTSPDTTCWGVYAQLQPYFFQALERYGQDVQALNQITQSLSLKNLQTDGKKLISSFQDCTGTKPLGDCGSGMTYTIEPAGIIARDGTQSVTADAYGFLRPESGYSTKPSMVNVALLAPAQVEVETCDTVQPWVPTFFGYKPTPFHVIGRAAATAVMSQQDWLQPGTLVNPWTDKPFQPPEKYINPAITDPLNGDYNWYQLDFGGQAWITDATNGSIRTPYIDDDSFSAYLGWWNSVPIHTFVDLKGIDPCGG